MNTARLLKALLGIAAVVVVLALIMNWVGDYRVATAKKRAVSTESGQPSDTTPDTQGSADSKPSGTTTKPAAAKPASEEVLVVLVDGLNFRSKPSGESRAMRGLAKGERIVLISADGEWYKVRDNAGVTGYITSNPAYTRREK